MSEWMESMDAGHDQARRNAPDGRTVTIEYPCLQCRYNLFGRTIDQACPECGKPIRESVPQGEKVYFFRFDRKLPNPMFRMEVFAAAVAHVIAIALVGLIVVLSIPDSTERLSFSIFLGWMWLVSLAGYSIGSWKKFRGFLVVVGDKELWHAREIGPLARIQFDQVRAQRCDRTGIAIIVFRTVSYCNVPATIEGFETLSSVLESKIPLPRISPWTWMLRDLPYLVSITAILIFLVPGIYFDMHWTTPLERGALLFGALVYNLVMGFIVWMPIRRFDKTLAIGSIPYVLMFVRELYYFLISF